MNATVPDAKTPHQDPSAEALVSKLLDLIDVEEIDVDLYRGARQADGRGRVFGGQVIAQALVSAIRSAEGRAAHSLHAYFMRAGDDRFPIIYRVARDFDGGSFSNRRVVAMQRGQPILNMTASFQRDEAGGLHHEFDMADVPPPEELVSERELARASGVRLPERIAYWLLRPRPIEVRPVEPRNLRHPEKRPPFSASWFRAVAPVGDDPDVHRAILGYASDMALLSTAMLPHGVHWSTHRIKSASLDHALWIHEPFRVDDWLLYATDSPWSGHGRGFNRGNIFTRDGTLIASTAQEALIRLIS